MENLNELYQAIWAGGERCTRHASVTKAVFLGAEPCAPRCRTLCSPVPEKCPVQKAFGMGDGRIASRAYREHCRVGVAAVNGGDSDIAVVLRTSPFGLTSVRRLKKNDLLENLPGGEWSYCRRSKKVFWH